ncbi:MAG: APC family permease, partial [Candidatus Nanohaloarchaea archaeon]|nr:APC family permease [Candidatus Nanohaloarchaea archaeon]
GENGGAFSFIEHAADNVHIAGFFGWVLVTGYVGVMAMYAYAFGAFTLTGLRSTVGITLPQVLRPVLSVGIVALLVGVNVAGVKLSGLYEDVMVYIKIVLLLSFAALGIVFYEGSITGFTLFDKHPLTAVTGFAIIFVSYEGFQLLTYDYNDIADVEVNLERGMFIAILIAMLIYVSVSFMATLQLTAAQLQHHGEVALAAAVSNIPLLGRIGFALVILSAIKSTSSGINATLFGASRLAHRIATEKEMPRVFSFRNREGIPVYALLIMGAATAVFAAVGSLKQITEFGSVAFLLADSAANYANLRLYDETGSHPVVPALGLLGTVVALPLVLHHLLVEEPHILLSIAAIFAALLIIEFLHIEREELEAVAAEVEDEIEDVEDEVAGDI